MTIIILGGKKEKKIGQLDIPFAETTFGKNYSKKKKEEISKKVSNLLCDYTSEEILLPSEDINKLEDMRKKGLRITSKNLFLLLSVDLTDDEIGRLVKLQRSGIFPKNREEIFQLSSSASESEKNLERIQFDNFLKEDGSDWWLSNMDYLLTMYPWWKIKGLYFYTKIDGSYHNCVSRMDDVVYLLGSHESKPHVKEKDILLCSEITMNEWKEIRPLFELFEIYIPKKGKWGDEDFFSKLTSLSSRDIGKLRRIGEYIINIGETDDQLSRDNKRNNLRINISILDFYGLLSLTQEQWGIVDEVMKEFFHGVKWMWHPSVGFLLKLASLSETDILKLRHCRDFGLEIDVENIFLLISDKLNNDKIKALVKLQKYFDGSGSDYEIGSYLSEKFILNVIESDEFCEFINSLDYGEDGYADRRFSGDISILLERDFGITYIKRLYYYFKIRSYDVSNSLDFREYSDLDELIDEYNDSPIGPEVIEFIYKKGLYKNDKQQILEQQVGEGRKGFFDDVNEDLINTINKRGLYESSKQQRCKDSYDTNEDLESFSLFNELPVRLLEFLQKNVESVDMESLEDLINVFTEFKSSSGDTYDNKVDVVLSIVEKCLSGRKDLSMNIVYMIFKFICTNIDNVDLLLKRIEFEEITVDDLLRICDIMYPGDVVKKKRNMDNKDLPSNDYDDLPF